MEKTSEWVGVIERFGVSFAILLAIGVFFYFGIWPFLKQHLEGSFTLAREQIDHWRTEAISNRESFQSTLDSIVERHEKVTDKIVERHERFAEKTERNIDRIVDSIGKLPCNHQR